MIRCARAARCSLCGLQAACLSHTTRAAAKPASATGSVAAPKVNEYGFSSVIQKAKRSTQVALAAVEGAEDVGTDSRLPVTILTGFLGSGKTTLLNTVLSQDHGLKIAIVENEFGAIDIDSNLIRAKENLEGVEVVESINGCICCTVRADLVETLRKLMASKKGQFDHVIIETTGMADPRPIISVFTTTDVGTALHLDGVVTMVDAKNVERHLDDEKLAKDAVNEALQQIAYADRVILNKTDLVAPEDIDRLKARVNSINKLAQVTTTQHAKVPVKYVLGVGGFDLERISEELSEPEKHSHDHSHDHSHGHDHSHDHDHSHEHGHAHSHSHEGHAEDAYHSHNHDHSHAHSRHDGVSSIALNIDGDLDLAMVNDWLVTVLEHMGPDLFRYKGILAIEGVDEQYVFQGVHEQFHGAQGREWQPEEKRFSRMVFIGRNIDDGLIQEGFEMCRAKKQKSKPLATSGTA